MGHTGADGHQRSGECSRITLLWNLYTDRLCIVLRRHGVRQSTISEWKMTTDARLAQVHQHRRISILSSSSHCRLLLARQEA